MTASSPRETIQVGTVLADTYQVTRLIGKGGMGAVWEAAHLRLQNKRVAIKVLLTEVARDAESVIRFRREANIASQIGHANIVQVYDIKELADGSHYIVLEYLEGEALDERMARGPMTPENAMPIVRQVASALQAAHHNGIVHRDLKPANIMLVPTEFGGYATEQAKVLDFGISKMQDSSTLKTQTATVLGTPQYMAPEQALGEHQKVDARTDIFALGCIVYEMLTGQIAFQGATIPEVMFKIVYQDATPLRELAPHVPERIADAVHRAMAKQQDDRFTDMSAFIEALTGDPLTTLRGGGAVAALPDRPPPLSASSKHARAHSQEAFAETMGPTAGPAMNTADRAASLADTLGAPGANPATASGVDAAPASGVDSTPAAQTSSGRGSFIPIVVVAALVAVAAVAITVMMMGGSKGEETAQGPTLENPATVPSTASPATVATNGETTGAGAVLADAGTSDASASAAGPDAESTGSSKDDDGSTSSKDNGSTGAKDDDGSTGSRDTARPGKLDPQALALVESARAHFKSGEYNDAIRAARKSIGIQSSNRAWSLITRSYCAKKDLSNAKASARNVTGRERRRVSRYCTQQGIAVR